jgi:hypothetical protein
MRISVRKSLAFTHSWREQPIALAMTHDAKGISQQLIAITKGCGVFGDLFGSLSRGTKPRMRASFGPPSLEIPKLCRVIVLVTEMGKKAAPATLLFAAMLSAAALAQTNLAPPFPVPGDWSMSGAGSCTLIAQGRPGDPSPQ